MKLTVDLSQLKRNAAEMKGLESYLTAVRETTSSFEQGIALATQYVNKNNGSVTREGNNTLLYLWGDVATCFKPFTDIDKFYFEI